MAPNLRCRPHDPSHMYPGDAAPRDARVRRVELPVYGAHRGRGRRPRRGHRCGPVSEEHARKDGPGVNHEGADRARGTGAL